jgi:hypothetical protein
MRGDGSPYQTPENKRAPSNQKTAFAEEFTLRRPRKFHGGKLTGAIGDEHWNAIDDRIVAPTAQASYGCPFNQQRLTADRADDPA